MQSVKLTRFETSTCIVSFKDYLKHVEEKEKARRKSATPVNDHGNSNNTKKPHGDLRQPSPLLSPEEERENTTIRRRKRYLRSWLKKVHPEKTGQSKTKPTQRWWNSWTVLLGAIVLFSAFFLLRFNEATYDADYELFQSNYDTLGIPRGSPWGDVKKAYRQLTFKWYGPCAACGGVNPHPSLSRHPDKNPGCTECSDRFVKITDAYKQITDFEKGTLRLINKPGDKR
jgi:hypothetical protein